MPIPLFTKLIAKHGKLSQAKLIIARVLTLLHATRPPAEENLARAIQLLAPLYSIKHFRGIIGGGQSLAVPQALRKRQRERVACKWILDSVSNPTSSSAPTSGNYALPSRIVSQVIAILDGKSTLLSRRSALHKLAVASRANIARTTR